MRTLVLSNFPAPLGETTNGGQQRFRRFVAALAPLSSSLRLLQYTPPHEAPGPAEVAALAARLSEGFGVPVSLRLLPYRRVPPTAWAHHGAGVFDAGEQPAFAPQTAPEAVRAVAEEMAQADFLFVCLLSSFLPVIRALRTGGRLPPRGLLFDLCDVEHVLRWRRLRGGGLPPAPRRLLEALQWPALVAAELRAARLATLTTLCSPLEVELFRRWGAERVELLPSAAIAPAAPPPPCREPTLLFLGALDYPPNAEAAERLAARIFPLIRRELPEARLVIAGRGQASVPSAAAPPPGVTFAGFVPDLAAAYAAARVVAGPILSGSGVRTKLIEAAGYARPMVSTALGAEGLAFKDGHDILIRETDADFAAACVTLLRDDALADRFGAAARETMLARYEEGAVRERLTRLVRARLRG